MPRAIKINNRTIGEGFPVFIAAEIGINHNGDMGVVKKLIDVAVFSGCDAVKFQKRTPELCVPLDQREKKRETPWGYISYFDYRCRMELGHREYVEIDRYCKEKKIEWFASCWDAQALEFIEQFEPPCYKVASASITDDELLKSIKAKGRPVLMSTGMSTMDQIRRAVSTIGEERLMLIHNTSTYPCKTSELNLKMIQTLRNEFSCPVGYSGHEVGLQVTYAAIVLGACYVERHITLDRTMWGSDQAASVEPQGMIRLVRDVRLIEEALGDGVKKVYESERPAMEKLRLKK